MFSKKLMASTIALSAVIGTAFGAASIRTGDVTARAGSLRVNPASATIKTGTTGTANTMTASGEPSRMATLPGLTNISTRPKLPSSASAATVADLKDKLSGLEADVDELRNAGVDEGAVRDIIDAELANKNYATVPYVDDADSGKLDKNVTFSKDDTHIIMTDGNGVTKNVALLADLKGDKGDKGDPGAAGTVDQAQLESTVNAAISGANLASKADLTDYVDKVTYESDKENIHNKITTAQSAAENAGTLATSAGSKADAALLAAQNAQSAADEKLTKAQADTYYADKDFSYSKAKVDELVAGAASGFDPNQVGAMINTAIDDKDLATNAALTELKDKVNNETTGLGATWSLASQNQTNITNLQTSKADKTDLDNYVDKPTYTADQESITSKITTAENNIVTLTANKADKDSVLPNNVKFAKQQIDNEDYYVLVNADDNSVIAPLARVEELKGEAGKEACSSLRLDPVSGDETTDKQVYNLVCVNED